MFSKFFRSTSVKAPRSVRGFKPQLEHLEDRALMAASLLQTPEITVINRPISERVLLGGEQNVLLNSSTLFASNYARAAAFTFVPTADSYGMEDITGASLWLDADRNGVLSARDRILATAAPGEDDTLDFRLTTRQWQLFGRRTTLPILVTGNIDPKPLGEYVGIELADVDVRNLRGRSIPENSIIFDGAPPVSHSIQQRADLAINAKIRSNPLDATRFFVDVQVHNYGPATATNVVTPVTYNGGVALESFLPKSFDIGSGTTMFWSHAFSFSRPGTVPPGWTSTVSFQVRSSTLDPDTSNNSASVQVQAPALADLYLTMSGPANVNAGGTVSYSLVAGNNGPVTSTGGKVIFALPPGTSFHASASSQGFEQFGTVLEAPLGALLAGQVRAFVVTLLVPSSHPGGPISANAKVVSSGIDPNVLNNAAPTITTKVVVPVVPMGNLYVTRGDNAAYIRSQKLLGGTLEVPILSVRLRAENEPINVGYFAFTPPQGFRQSLDRLELYKKGEATPFATATVGAAQTDPVLPGTLVARMQNNQLVIPAGEEIIVLVRPRIKSDVDGAVSGEEITLFVSEIRANGTKTSKSLAANDNDGIAEGEVFFGADALAVPTQVHGPSNTVVFSEISAVTNANPDAHDTNVPTGVSDIGQFKFTAAANNNAKNGLNKVEIRSVSFIVFAANVDVDSSSYRLFNKANSTVYATGVVTPYGVNAFTVTFDLLGSSVNAVIDQGTDQTFVVQANVLNSKVSSGSPSHLIVVADLNSLFRWVDYDTVIERIFSGSDLDLLHVQSTTYRN